MGTSEKCSIQFYNRYTKSLETEAVYGGRWLQWAYGTSLGRLTTRMLLKRALFSKFYGWLMKRPGSRKKVAPFIKEFAVDMAPFAKQADAFDSFNDFFIRELKPGARPIVEDPQVACFPADGRHLGFQDVSEVSQVFIKGQRWDLAQLLGSEALAGRYARGSLVLSRLCPVDYHRFHFPVAGFATQSKLIPGCLSSVNPVALRQRLAILGENKRTMTLIQTEQFGQVLMLEIGATCVGSVVQTFSPQQACSRGAEKGFFSFGGSATCLLFEPERIQLAEDLREQTQQGYELYAHMGDTLGVSL